MRVMHILRLIYGGGPFTEAHSGCKSKEAIYFYATFSRKRVGHSLVTVYKRKEVRLATPRKFKTAL